MTAGVNIVNGDHSVEAKVSKRGELVTGRLKYSVPHYINVAAAATPYEVVRGKAGQQFVITDMLLATDKDFGSATVEETLTIYGAHPADLATNIDTVVNIGFLRNDRLVATGLNMITAEACSIVAIGTDSAVDVTIAGYYVDA